MKYTITIEETVAKDFEIEARGADEAYEIAERKYKSDDFVLDPGRSLNSLINRLEKGNLVEKDILVRNMVSNLEIDAQKRVIYRYKSPFNFIFEPEFSTGSPVGEPSRIAMERPHIRYLPNKGHHIGFVSYYNHSLE